MRWMAFDIETAGREDAVALLPEPQPDKRLTDPAKIAADLERKRAEQMERLPLDANGARIAVIGLQANVDDKPQIWFGHGPDLDHERFAIQTFWEAARNRTLISFCGRRFDLQVIIQRSRLLGLPIPPWRELLAPYGRSRKHIDLYDELTFDNGRSDGVVPTRLKTFCKQFGIDIPDDDGDGQDVAALLKAGNLEAVRQHCARDVERTVALARALKVIPALEQAEMVL